MNNKPKLIQTSALALSLDFLLKGQLKFLNELHIVVSICGDDSFRNYCGT